MEIATQVPLTTGVVEAAGQPTVIRPVAAYERIASIDVLRGVAVLGILLMNIADFGLPLAYFNPSVAGGHTGLNLVYWFTNQVLFEGKMRALFSLLFGAGVVLLTRRAEERGGGIRVADIYYRRTLWLVLFGLLHAYFIWWGDILYYYGVCGLILFPLRKTRPKALLAAGLAMLLILTGKSLWNDYSDLQLRNQAGAAERASAEGRQLSEEQKDSIKKWDDKRKQLYPDEMAIAKNLETHRGSYWKLFTWRAEQVRDGESLFFYRYGFFDAAGMMLIGMALMMLGVFTAQLSARTYAMIALIGYGIGGTLNAITGWYFVHSGFNMIEGVAPLNGGYHAGRLSVALGHIGLVMLVVKTGQFRRLTSRLAAVGQSALSCYLTTSVLCTTIFYGYGFGLYGKLQRYQLLYVVFGVWLLLLTFAPIWLRHCRFGPMEWVWRSLTHWQKQPMRIRRTAAAPAQSSTTPEAVSQM